MFNTFNTPPTGFPGENPGYPGTELPSPHRPVERQKDRDERKTGPWVTASVTASPGPVSQFNRY